MNHTIGLIIEATVAVLLAITIGYCYILDRRLRRFRADEQSLRAVIAELITATEIAERAIAGLKVTVHECDRDLGDRLRAAERFSASIEQQIAAGEVVLRRLAQVAAAARPASSASALPVAPASAPTPPAVPAPITNASPPLPRPRRWSSGRGRGLANLPHEAVDPRIAADPDGAAGHGLPRRAQVRGAAA